jgi:hypothetical protein
MSEKWCKDCGELKPLDQFYKSAGMRDGHRNDCKTCNLAEKRRRYAADPAKYKAFVKRWQQANNERLNAYRREHNARPERKRALRDGYYRRKFGISADEFDELLDKQGGGCAICRKRPERDASLHLDHDHETGVVRGILCLSCNQGIGKFRDDAGLLERAAAYLRGGGAFEAGGTL